MYQLIFATFLIAIIIYTHKKLTDKFITRLIYKKNKLTAQRNLLAEQVKKDSLTNLKNRDALIHELRENIAEPNNTKNLALVGIDINNFSDINDKYGYDVGDAIIIEYSKTLQKLVNNNSFDIDEVYRISGDEFVLITEVSSLNYKDELARLYKYITNITTALDIYIKDLSINISVKAYAAIFPIHGKTCDEMVTSLHIAQLYAKKKKNNEISIYENFMFDEIKNRAIIEQKITQALSNNSFELYSQKIVDLNTKNFVGEEVLIRWKDDEFGNISPDEFIPIAEDNGQIIYIDCWVVKNVYKMINSSTLNNNDNYYYSINVSPRTLELKDFIPRIKMLIDEHKITDFSNIAFEVTEHSVVEDTAIIDNLNELQALGFKILLDDFGTGYNSFSHLINLPLDFIKIDKVFIDNIKDKKNERLFKAALAMMQNMEYGIVVEGVENQEQCNWLSSFITYDKVYLQGYHFDRPSKLKITD